MEALTPDDQEADLAWFYALYDSKVSNLEDEYKSFHHKLPKELLAIAYASGNDQICICIDGPNYGKIYFWDIYNQAPENQEPWWENVYLIANSFTEFINGLYEYDLGENDTIIRRYQDGRVTVTKD